MDLPDFYFQVLGANSAVPYADRFPSSFVLGYKDHLHLIDCGEGSQMKMAEFGVRKHRINHIFISHLHGDHLFGLPGFINSLSLNGRTRPLYIVAPRGIEDYLSQIFKITGGHVSYDIIFTELTGDSCINLGEHNGLQVTAFPLMHRIPTFGYLFCEVIDTLNINPTAIDSYDLSIAEIRMAKRGEVIKRRDREIRPEEITFPPKRPRSFAYCSDTQFHLPIVDHIRGADLLYHEATYLEESADKALQHMHSTAIQAATIAKQASVKKLLIGHYSSRYESLTPLANEAITVFQDTEVAIQGTVHEIPVQV